MILHANPYLELSVPAITGPAKAPREFEEPMSPDIIPYTLVSTM